MVILSCLELKELNNLHMSCVGYFDYEQVHFVTRHPLPYIQKVNNPMKSLHHYFWITYTMVYFFFALASTIFYWKLRSNFLAMDLLEIWLTPSDTKWFRIMRAGLLFQLLWTFVLWTFDILFGIDLWTVLMVQKFEPHVNNWDDISWHETMFIFVVSHKEDKPQVIQPGQLELNLFQTQNLKSRYGVIDSSNTKLLTHTFQLAQVMDRISSLVFTMTK